MTFTRVHTFISFANPFLVCDECGESVARFHDPARCGCEGKPFANDPCGHAGVTSTCPSWGPVDGCRCATPHRPASPVVAPSATDEGERWVDRHGDVWTFDADGIGTSPECANFSRKYVERKWGPLRPAPDAVPSGEATNGTTPTKEAGS